MRTKHTFLIFLSILALWACKDPESSSLENGKEATDSLANQQNPIVNSSADGENEPLVEDVLTKEEQEALTPEEVVSILKTGNNRFMNNDITRRDHSAMVRKTTYGQYPKAIILSCVDSRVPVEDVFDRGIGDLFVARVAGNFENEDILGSMEFACKVAGSKLIVVLGHEHCGAVKAAVDGVEMGNVTSLVNNIEPAMDDITIDGEKSSKNEQLVHKVVVSNVEKTVKDIRDRSQILRDMEAAGDIQIMGAVYDMDNGQVSFMEM